METTFAYRWAFLSRSVRNFRQVGAVAPSSRALAASVAALARGQTRIVELGSGTGALTEALLGGLPQGGKLFAFEVDSSFRLHLGARFSDPRLEVSACGAQRLSAELRRNGWEAPGCIVSGLPFQAFPRLQSLRILLEIRRSLPAGGRFIAFQYTPLLWPLFRRVFPEIRVERVVMRNLPPALVLVADL